MKKLLKIVAVVAAVTAALCINASAVKLSTVYVGIDENLQSQINEEKTKQKNAHTMAEAARALGLDETHAAITEAQDIWADSQEQISKLSGMLTASREIDVPFGPHTPTGLTAAAFNKMLEGTAMAGTGASFVRMEQETGTNGLFAIGVAGSESGIGAACYGYNPYGMLSSGGLICYSSWGDATMAFGRLIASNTYRRANSVSAINAIYCPGDGGYWTSKVNSFMRSKLAKLS
nr:MAG TPA: autolysin E [Caudoviricetes sp.]